MFLVSCTTAQLWQTSQQICQARRYSRQIVTITKDNSIRLPYSHFTCWWSKDYLTQRITKAMMKTNWYPVSFHGYFFVKLLSNVSLNNAIISSIIVGPGIWKKLDTVRLRSLITPYCMKDYYITVLKYQPKILTGPHFQPTIKWNINPFHPCPSC